MIRIAVVDDNEMIRKQVKRFLNTYALKNSVVFEIYTYEDGHLLTLDINHEMHFDLIYLDIEMPIQNGIQVGHWIREIAQDEWMQIVFISGKDGYDRKLFSINCLDFLSKPRPCEKISVNSTTVIKNDIASGLKNSRSIFYSIQ